MILMGYNMKYLVVVLLVSQSVLTMKH